MLVRHLVALSCASFLVALTAACGSSDGSAFGNGGDPNKDPNNGGNNQFADGDGGTNTGPGGLGDLAACATSSANGSLVPVNLVVMFDQSGSMGRDDNGNNVLDVKWNPVVQAFETFFADKGSAGMSASLQYFPLGGNKQECNQANYAAPEVALTTLPNSTAFQGSLVSHQPGGGTPTKPALGGAIAYAQQVAQQKPNDKTVVVLVTDGEPNDCNSDVQNVSDEAAAVAAKIPTYVVGVGSSLQNLDAIAAAGGTQKAIVVNVSDANGTAASFLAALNAIRGQVGSCDFTLPQPPAGQTLDINAVNVVFTPSGGSPQTLSYNAACTGGAGWHYNNPTAPTQIVLCQSTCDTAKADKGGKIAIAFGCATKGGVK